MFGKTISIIGWTFAFGVLIVVTWDLLGFETFVISLLVVLILTNLSAISEKEEKL